MNGSRSDRHAAAGAGIDGEPGVVSADGRRSGGGDAGDDRPHGGNDDIAIEFRHVSKVYDGHTVLDDLNLKIARGEFVTMVGTSGGGKTTTLKMVNGLISPTSGDVIVGGKNVRDCDLIKLRRSIGYAIQGSVLFPHMTVEQNIAYVPNLWNGRADRDRTHQAVLKWLDIVGLSTDMLDRYPADLSGGQQQRVGIARALAASPRILLMDEPFGAVDEITRTQLQDEIKRIHKETGITVLFVTHDMSEALKLGTKVLVISEGTMRQYGTPDEVLHQPADAFVERLVANVRGV